MSKWSYWDEEVYMRALTIWPEIVVFQLGTNDAWQWNEEKFTEDWIEMVTSLKKLSSSPKVYVMVPPPLYHTTFPGPLTCDPKLINETLPKMIVAMA